MTNDAKLGLLAGLAAVLLMAVVYCRKQQPADDPPGTLPAPKQTAPLPPPPVSVVPKSAWTPGTPSRTPPLSADPLFHGPSD